MGDSQCGAFRVEACLIAIYLFSYQSAWWVGEKGSLDQGVVAPVVETAFAFSVAVAAVAHAGWGGNHSPDT